jgi:methylmalonyl-CoA/ethylmalonyl-CoA epimerase
MLKKINHIGIAVKNLEETAKFYQNVLDLTLSGVEVVPAQKTKVGYLKIGDSNIELVQPSEPDSPVAKFLETKGQGIHHICFEVDDIESEIKTFIERGATMVDQKPKPGSHNKKVAFVHPKSSSGVLIELCELPKED